VSAGILTRWAVVREGTVHASEVRRDGRPTDEAVRRWFADAREFYLDRCRKLGEESRAGRVRLSETAVDVPPGPPLIAGETLLVAVSVTELRPSSFDMAFRVRGLSAGGSVVATGRCTVELVDEDGHRPALISPSVRQDILAMEAAATDYC
jgi:acyl-CoA thioesterase FadM